MKVEVRRVPGSVRRAGVVGWLGAASAWAFGQRPLRGRLHRATGARQLHETDDQARHPGDAEQEGQIHQGQRSDPEGKHKQEKGDGQRAGSRDEPLARASSGAVRGGRPPTPNSRVALASWGRAASQEVDAIPAAALASRGLDATSSPVVPRSRGDPSHCREPTSKRLDCRQCETPAPRRVRPGLSVSDRPVKLPRATPQPPLAPPRPRGEDDQSRAEPPWQSGSGERRTLGTIGGAGLRVAHTALLPAMTITTPQRRQCR